MNNQPDALRLAHHLEGSNTLPSDQIKAAAELRRLAEVEKERDRLKESNQAMLEANKASLLVLCALSKADWHPNVWKDIDFAIQANRAAIAKATTP